MSEEKEVGATFVLDVVTGIRQGALSPVALIDELIARIDSLNPRLRAFISVARESARAGARAAERTLVADGACGPLHGVPYACKDVFWTRDLPTTAGSRVLEGWTAEQDATAVQRATGAGAILIGKTNLHEFAYGATGENPHSGTVPNPWDAKRIAGGSSSGSAAAVACDLVPFALGTDTGGSVRVPAALCGVVGIKPTYGLVSTHGVIPFCWSLDHVGIFTRSVADAALVLEVLAGHDPHDPASASVNVPNYGRALSGDLRGLSVGVPRQHFFDRLDPEIEAAALDVLGHIERLGGRIIDVEPPDLSSARTVALLLQMPEALSYHSQFLRDKRELYGEELRSGLAVGQFILAEHYVRAKRMVSLYRRQVAEIFEKVDLLLTPASPIIAPHIGTVTVTLGDATEPVGNTLTRFTSFFNMTGNPALALPCGWHTAGLPMAVQLVARPFEEATLLRAADAIERTVRFPIRRPALA